MANAANAAIGMIETKGLVALVQATDAMLKAAPVQYAGWRKIGSGLAPCSSPATSARCARPSMPEPRRRAWWAK